MRKILQVFARWQAVQSLKDTEHAIAFHRRQLAALPDEIARLERIRKQHAGRAATLTERRNTVNYNLGR